MSTNPGANKLVKGALFLTLAGFVSKILSATYRIPLQNVTGDLGFYMYQQVYPFLGITLILSLYGFPSAVSKMIVELKTEGKGPSFNSFYLPVLSIMLGINGLFFLCIYVSADVLASWIGDVTLVRAFRFAAFAFLLIPIPALLRGVFQGSYQMKPTAYSQVAEQFVRVFFIISIAYLFIIQKIDVYQIGELATLASILGAFTAIGILGIFFLRNKPIVATEFVIPWGYYFRTLLMLGLVASLNHMVLLIIQFADVFTLVPSLMKHGYSQLEAMEAKGIFDRGQPLIQLGTVLGSSFALALIPVISKRKLVEDPNRFCEFIQSALLFSFYIAAGAGIGLIVIFPEANALLFQDMKGTSSLQILAISIFLSSIAITASSILQGLGYFMRTAGFILFAFVIKWVANLLLVPWWGITGSAIATVFSLFTLCLFVLFEMKRKLPQIRFLQQINYWALCKASLGMIGYILLVDFLFSHVSLPSRLELLCYVLFVSITGAFIYILLLLRCKAFTQTELSLLPFSPLFIRLSQFHKCYFKQ